MCIYGLKYCKGLHKVQLYIGSLAMLLSDMGFNFSQKQYFSVEVQGKLGDEIKQNTGQSSNVCASDYTTYLYIFFLRIWNNLGE